LDLRNTVGGSHIVFLGPDETNSDPWPVGAVTVRPSLRELMALLTCCDILVCNDSGPMHVADALGVPVAAIFEIGNPQWFGPSGPRATVIAGELAGTGLSAAPLDTPPRNPVSVTCVADVVRRTLRTQS
jgi:ADP-heptose:LPS heptosyltransferase